MQKFIGIGNLTKDIELSQTNNGICVAKFTIAIQRKFKNEEGKTEADFFNVVVWRELAENCKKYLSKGKKVCIIGRLQNRSYDAQDGTKRFVTEIVADEVEFLSPIEHNKEQKETQNNIKPIDDDSLPF